MVHVEVDFTKHPFKLFTGRKKGNEYVTKFRLDKVKESPILILKANPDQVITSSFFIGLLEHLYPNNKPMFVSVIRLPEKSKKEYERAFKRLKTIR